MGFKLRYATSQLLGSPVYCVPCKVAKRYGIDEHEEVRNEEGKQSQAKRADERAIKRSALGFFRAATPLGICCGIAMWLRPLEECI